MAGSPIWKVYDEDNHYLASCKEPEMCAAIIAGVGRTGWTIRHGHSKIVFTEGLDGTAGESYDTAAEIASQRAARITSLEAQITELKAALEGLFENCAMMHKHWGENDNTRQADAAIQAARAVLAKYQEPT